MGAVGRRIKRVMSVAISVLVFWPGPPPSRTTVALPMPPYVRIGEHETHSTWLNPPGSSGKLLSLRGRVLLIEGAEHVQLLDLAGQERNRFLEMAFDDPDFVTMMGFLEEEGFTPLPHATNVVQVWLFGKYARTVVYTTHQSEDGTLAHAVFGIEKNGMRWVGGTLPQKEGIKLLTVKGGIVQPLQAGQSAVLLQQCGDCRYWCNIICGILCGGLCGLGCGLACLLICGIVNVCCAIICGTICGAACGGLCALGCDYICSRVC
ncbi:hypothetical protein HRbin10_00735 [bacterium HR10]|nr:hypothetical protein HRbin10_00735 [bacterium HR10]